MISFAAQNMEAALQQLWRECFGDSETYTRFLFAHLLRLDRVLVCCDAAHHPDAMLCLEPFTLVSSGKQTSGAYIFGLATRPERQGQGLGTQILKACHRYLAANGFALSALVPASDGLFGFYKERGYTTACSIVKETLRTDQIPAAGAPCVLRPAHLEMLFSLREAIYRTRSGFVRWTPDYLRYIHEECRAFGGEVLTIGCRGNLGYAVCYREGTHITIKELALRDADIPDALAALHQRYHAETYTLYLPSDTELFEKKGLPFAMVRWYDKEKQVEFSATGGKAPWIAHVLD